MAIDPAEIERLRPFRRDGLGYVWQITDKDIEIKADYIFERFHDIHAQVIVSRSGKLLHMANFNLSNTAERQRLCSNLSDQTNGLQLPWGRIIEGFCVKLLQAEREPGTTQYTTEAPKLKPRYLVDKLIMQGKTNMLFAPGGSGKGMFCVAICCALIAKRGIGQLTVVPATPYYFDWEDDFDTFRDRVNAIARGFGITVPKVPYRRMHGVAADRINEMARALSECDSDFGIIDSFSAAGGTSEHASWDTIAHRLFDALDLIPGMTWLIIDHVTKAARHNDPAGAAYGSIQKMNRVRNAWEMRADQEPGESDVHMKFYDAKWNHRGKDRPFGLRMEFRGDDVCFRSEDVVMGLNSVADKIAWELERGPLSIGMLAHELDVPDNTIRQTLRRNPDRFERDPDGVYVRLKGAVERDAA